jgi:hypothetical protein
MDITSDHLDVVARGGYGWREEVDDGEEIARRSETFGHPVGKSTSFRISCAHTVLNPPIVGIRRSLYTASPHL